MANKEHGLLSHIIRHGNLDAALEWGLREEDFTSDIAKKIFDHMLFMRRNPSFTGGQMGVQSARDQFPSFELCDDAAMTLEAYCMKVRRDRLLQANAGVAQELIDTSEDPNEVAEKCIARLRASLELKAGTSSSRRSPAMFALQPSEKEMRKLYMVPDLGIGPGAPSLIVGAGYTGKTAAAQALALAVAGGNKIWGRFETKRGKVLHVDGEQGKRVTEQRYRQLARGMGLNLSKLDSPVVEYRPPPLVKAEKQSRLSCNEVAWETLAQGFDLVIVDNLSALSPGLQENSSEIRLVLDMLARISERTGATFLVLHHTTKPGPNSARGRASIRGSGAIFDAASTVLVFERDDAMADYVHVTCPKTRGGLDAEPARPFRISKQRLDNDAFQLTAQMDGDAYPLRAQTEGLEQSCQRVIEAITKVGGTVSSIEKLRVLTHMGAKPVREVVKVLVDRGRLRKQGFEIHLTVADSVPRAEGPSSPSAASPDSKVVSDAQQQTIRRGRHAKSERSPWRRNQARSSNAT